MSSIAISKDAARQFLRRALLLDHPATSVGEVLEHLGYVQIDPINVCGRMHDLILRNRVAGYREGDLMRHLHGDEARDCLPLQPKDRAAFEQYLPGAGVLVAMPLEAWPHLPASIRAREARVGAWSGALDARQAAMAERILAAVAERGPLNAEAVEDTARDTTGWGGSGRLAKVTIDKLFFHGRLLIARRDNYRRVYDLPDRVLPAALLAAPEPTPEENGRWRALVRLRQRRLVRLKRHELPLVADQVQAVSVDAQPVLHILRSDLRHLEAALVDDRRPESVPLLLAPLDPLIYDRALARALWDFDYTWEVYTPEAKRQRGYYALPALQGSEIVGHVDPKADRAAGKLRVIGKRMRRGYSATAAVQELARFLGLRH
jgi:uncharacterized protein